MKKEKTTTKLCKHCKTEIPYEAKICPHCKKKQGMGIVPKVIIGIIVVCVIGGALGAPKDSSEDTPQNTSEASANTESNVSETLRTTEAPTKEEDNVPSEYKSALNKAISFSGSFIPEGTYAFVLSIPAGIRKRLFI